MSAICFDMLFIVLLCKLENVAWKRTNFQQSHATRKRCAPTSPQLTGIALLEPVTWTGVR